MVDRIMVMAGYACFGESKDPNEFSAELGNQLRPAFSNPPAVRQT